MTKLTSLASSEGRMRLHPSEGPSLNRLKERIERQKALRQIVPAFETTKSSKSMVRKVTASQGPNTYLGFNTGVAEAPSKPQPKSKPVPEVVKKPKKPVTKRVKKQIDVKRKVSATPVQSKPVITTRSWRDSQKAAKQRLKTEKKSNEKDVSQSNQKSVSSGNDSEPVKGTGRPEPQSEPIEINDIADGILSSEVRGILKDLNLDEKLAEPSPRKEKIESKQVVKKSGKNVRKKSPRDEEPVRESEVSKKRHYDQDEVKQFMEKQRAQRRKNEIRKNLEKKKRESKIESEMQKLKEHQAKGAKKLKPTQKPTSKNQKSKISSEPDFDPLAKAMEIISELDHKSTKFSEFDQKSTKSTEYQSLPDPKKLKDSSLKSFESGKTHSIEKSFEPVCQVLPVNQSSQPSESAESSIIPDKNTFNPLAPAKIPHSPETGAGDQPLTPQNRKVLEYISNSIQSLDFQSSVKMVLAESTDFQPKVQKEHQDLLENLRKKSLDIKNKTSQWEEKIKGLSEERDRKIFENPPGAKSLVFLANQISPAPVVPVSAKTPTLENSQKLPIFDDELPSLIESTSSIENHKPARKPVKFQKRAKSPDKLNIVDLMYQKERERRRETKEAKNEKKRRRKEKNSSQSSFETGTSCKDLSLTGSIPVVALKSSKSDRSVTTSSLSTVTPKSSSGKSSEISKTKTGSSRSIETGSVPSRSSRVDSSYEKPVSETESIKDSVSFYSGLVTESVQSTTDGDSSRKISTDVDISSRKTSTDEFPTRKISSETNFSENYSSIPTSSAAESDGQILLDVMKTQLREAETAEIQLRALENFESKKFLDEMREIQNTGKKAAELMLKASKNLAAKAEISLPTSTSETITGTTVRNETGTNRSDLDRSYSTSGTITSKISPRTESISDGSKTLSTKNTGTLQVGTETVTSNYTSKTPVSVKTSTISDETETEDGKISESLISEKSLHDSSAQDSYSTFASDMDVSTRLLTPSVEHWRKINDKIRKRIPSEMSDASTDADPMNDSFTRFMADMVQQYVADEKSTRTRFHYAMLNAREKALKEKKTRDKAFEAKIEKSRKNRTSSSRKGEDEKMPKRKIGVSDASESDTSSCTIDRVKKWFSLDEKHLTQRENILQKRRKKAEKLIAWKARLDEQEKSVLKIEEKASEALKEKRLRTESTSRTSTTAREIESQSLPDSATTEETLNATIYSETDLDQSDAEARMRVMREQLKEREKMAAKLRRALAKQSNSKKKELKIHESTLQKQIEQFDKMIQEAQSQLQNLEDLDHSGSKPKIKSPRKESTGSCSSNTSLKRLNSSENSDFSPRRSPINRSSGLLSPKTASSISSESLNSQVEDDTRTGSSKVLPTTAKTEMSSKSEDSENVLKSSIESSVSVIEACTERDSKSEISENYTYSSEMTSQLTSHVMSQVISTSKPDETSSKPVSPPPLPPKSVSVNFPLPRVDTVQEAQNNVTNNILNTILAEIIRPLSNDHKKKIITNLKGESDFQQQNERESYSSSEEGEDGSLFDTLLDHVESVKCDEVLENTLDEEKQTRFLPPKKRTFEEIRLQVNHFCSYLYYAPFPFPEKIPIDIITPDESDLQEALWSLCSELTSELMRPDVDTNRPRPKFARFPPKSLEELKTLVTGEIIRLLSPHGPKLDKRILYKMGARPKKDRVDMLLIGELREEEIEWTNYEQDESNVKDHLVDSIFEILIDDTLLCVKERFK